MQLANIVCRDGCPGTNFPCEEPELFNVDGVCVDDEERKKIETKGKSDVASAKVLIDKSVYSNRTNSVSRV